jgi:hypothetical protein
MKRIGYSILFTALAATTAFATPIPNSAVLHPRVFNDCPFSIAQPDQLLSPALIRFDRRPTTRFPRFASGFANLQRWRFSSPGRRREPPSSRTVRVPVLSQSRPQRRAGEAGLRCRRGSPRTRTPVNVSAPGRRDQPASAAAAVLTPSRAAGLVYTNNTPNLASRFLQPQA